MTKLSRKLSLVLRHTAKDLLLEVKNGYVLVDDLLKLDLFTNFTLEDIKHAVLHDSKQRFHLLDMKIKANQGHSFEVDLELLQITLENSPEFVHHKTKKQNEIKKEGLKRMKRIHIHCTENKETLKIKIRETLKDGMLWFKSLNNVYLTRGFDGIIPIKYILFE